MTAPQTPAEVRRQLLRGGFTPLPLYGKAPVIGGFGQKPTRHHRTRDPGPGSRMHPAAQNTGILTRLTPTLDIDILDPDAARAVELLLLRDRFEDKGRILVRFGNAPKRCIPFQTIEAFPQDLPPVGRCGHASSRRLPRYLRIPLRRPTGRRRGRPARYRQTQLFVRRRSGPDQARRPSQHQCRGSPGPASTMRLGSGRGIRLPL